MLASTIIVYSQNLLSVCTILFFYWQHSRFAYGSITTNIEVMHYAKTLQQLWFH
jgi:hypothetical protein